MTKSTTASLTNPFANAKEVEFSVPGQASYEPGLYEESLKKGYDLINRPKTAPGVDAITRQHSKNRMTIWERISVLTDEDPQVLFQNWGKNLDGAGIVTAVVKINGRDVALYGHDFTIRAGSMEFPLWV